MRITPVNGVGYPIAHKTNYNYDARRFTAMMSYDRTTETIRYQIDNHLGSASLELDESAAIISYEEYHPFGTTSYRAGRSDTETSLKRYKYVGKERDEETGLYYYGARYYASWIGRFVSVDPLNDDYPELSSYQYASNRPIIAIDLDGLEAKISVYGTGEKRGDESQFKFEANYDKEKGSSDSAHKITTGDQFINLLKNKTSQEGEIERISIYSHSTPHAIYLDDNQEDYGGILRSKYKGLGNYYENYKNTTSIPEISELINKGEIRFTDDALVIFAGCNAGSYNDSEGEIEGRPFAEDFTMTTGIRSIAAIGASQPENKGSASRKATTGFYLFERIDNEDGEKSIKKTFLGKSIEPSDYRNRDKEKIEKIMLRKANVLE